MEKWVIMAKRADFNGIAARFHIDPVIARLIRNRDVVGDDAIEAFKVIQALNEMEHEWLLKYKHPLLPPPNLNIGVISGGEAGSTVPGFCSFSTCVHYLPGLMDTRVPPACNAPAPPLPG